MNCTGPLAAGVKAVPDGKKAASHAQAMGRFLANPRVTPDRLSVPLLAATREAVTADGGEYVLAVADWSRVNDGGHASKRDRLQMTHATDVGDELQSSLLVSAEDGAPLGVPVQNLVTAQGVWSSCADTISPDDRHPDLYPGVAPGCAADRGGTSRPAVSRALVRQADEGISPCYPLRLVGWRFHTVRHPRFP